MGVVDKERVLESLSSTGDTLDSDRARQFYERNRRNQFRDEMAETRKSSDNNRPQSARGFSGYKPGSSSRGQSPVPAPSSKQNVGFGSTVNRVQSKLDPTNPNGVYAYVHENGPSNNTQRKSVPNEMNPFKKPVVGKEKRSKRNTASVNYTDFVPVESRHVDDVQTVTRAPTTRKHATVNNMLTLPSKSIGANLGHEEAADGWPSTLSDNPVQLERLDAWPYHPVHTTDGAKIKRPAVKPQGLAVMPVASEQQPQSRSVELVPRPRILSPVKYEESGQATIPSIVVDENDQTVTVPLQMITEISAAIQTLQKYNINVPQTLVKVPINGNASSTPLIYTTNPNTTMVYKVEPVASPVTTGSTPLTPTSTRISQSPVKYAKTMNTKCKAWGDVALELSLIPCSEVLPSEARILSLPLDDGDNEQSLLYTEEPVSAIPRRTSPVRQQVRAQPTVEQNIEPIVTPSRVHEISAESSDNDDNEVVNMLSNEPTPPELPLHSISRKQLDEDACDVALTTLLQCSDNLDIANVHIPFLPMEDDDAKNAIEEQHSIHDSEPEEFTSSHRGIAIDRKKPAVVPVLTTKTSLENSVPPTKVPSLKLGSLFSNIEHQDDDLLESRRGDDLGTHRMQNLFVDIEQDNALPSSTTQLSSSVPVITLPMAQQPQTQRPMEQSLQNVPIQPQPPSVQPVQPPVPIQHEHVQSIEDDSIEVDVEEDVEIVSTATAKTTIVSNDTQNVNNNDNDEDEIDIFVAPTPVQPRVNATNNNAARAIGIYSQPVDIALEQCLPCSSTPLDGSTPVISIPNTTTTTTATANPTVTSHGHRGISISKPSVKPVLFPTAQNSTTVTTTSTSSSSPHPPPTRPAVPSRMHIKPLDIHSRSVKSATRSATNSPASTPKASPLAKSVTPTRSATHVTPSSRASSSHSRRAQSPSTYDTLKLTESFAATAAREESSYLNSDGLSVYPEPNTEIHDPVVAAHVLAIRQAEKVDSAPYLPKKMIDNDQSDSLMEDTRTLQQRRQMQMLRDTTELILVNEQCPGALMTNYTQDILNVERGFTAVNQSVQADQKQIRSKQRGEDYTDVKYPVQYDQKPRFQETIKFYQPRRDHVEVDPDFDSELDEPDVDEQPVVEGCINPFQLPNSECEPGLELLPTVLNRINDLAQQDRQRVIAGELPSDDYIDREDQRELLSQHKLHYECTPEAASDFVSVPGADELYAAYRARDTFEERTSSVRDMQQVLRQKEEQIKNKKKHSDMYKGALPYWYEMRGPQFHDEMARNRVFGDSIARLVHLNPQE